MRKQTVDLIDDIVQSLLVSINILTVVTNSPGNYTVTMPCTWWLQPGVTIDLGGNFYKILSFTINKELVLESVGSPVLPVIGSYALPVPTYYHGTLKMTQNEVDGQPDKTLITPFVYLFEVLRDKKNTDFDSMIDRETDLRIFFVHSANFSDWLTDDHYTNVIDPMQSMVDLFINKIENNRFFTDEINYDCLPLINLSEEGNQEKSIFDCNLSGIELKLFAEIRKDLSCVNKSSCIV